MNVHPPPPPPRAGSTSVSVLISLLLPFVSLSLLLTLEHSSKQQAHNALFLLLYLKLYILHSIPVYHLVDFILQENAVDFSCGFVHTFQFENLRI